MISRNDLMTAYERVKRFVRPTPLMTFQRLNEHFGAQVWLKCEQFQPIGAFKLRGASNFVLQLSEGARSKGLVTHSSGNHAQAVAYVAHHLGVAASIVMPKNSNRVKIANARRWGAKVILCEPTVEAREETASRVQEETGSILVPPYDHEWIIAGQASCAMEVFREKSSLNHFFTPLGGGGLLSGTALAAHYFSGQTGVIGTEPTQASDGFEGFHSGERVTKVQANTVADGLRTVVGEQPFEVIRKYADDIWLAEEEAIVRWMYTLWDWTKLVIEPSGAVPFAAMDQQRDKVRGKEVAVVVTGGNVDFSQLPG